MKKRSHFLKKIMTSFLYSKQKRNDILWKTFTNKLRKHRSKSNSSLTKDGSYWSKNNPSKKQTKRFERNVILESVIDNTKDFLNERLQSHLIEFFRANLQRAYIQTKTIVCIAGKRHFSHTLFADLIFYDKASLTQKIQVRINKQKG